MVDWLRGVERRRSRRSAPRSIDGVDDDALQGDGRPRQVSRPRPAPSSATLMRKAVDSDHEGRARELVPDARLGRRRTASSGRCATVLTETIQGQTVNVVTSERFYDFGAPVDIALPPDEPGDRHLDTSAGTEVDGRRSQDLAVRRRDRRAGSCATTRSRRPSGPACSTCSTSSRTRSTGRSRTGRAAG